MFEKVITFVVILKYVYMEQLNYFNIKHNARELYCSQKLEFVKNILSFSQAMWSRNRPKRKLPGNA